MVKNDVVVAYRSQNSVAPYLVLESLALLLNDFVELQHGDTTEPDLETPARSDIGVAFHPL